MLTFKFDGVDLIDVESNDGYECSLSLKMAELLLEELTAAVADLREAVTQYVQVRFDLARNSAGMTYTYSDPSGTLRVGDLVQCPVYDGQLQTAKVVALGRGAWTGRTKSVAARLEATPL